MINLLPPQGKKRVTAQYRLRVVSTYLILIGVALVVIGILFLPAYFQVLFQKKAYENQLYELAAGSRIEMIEAEFEMANRISDIILDTKQYVDFGAVLDTVFTLGQEGVTLSSMQLDKEEGAIERINVTGIASNRESLIGFRDALREHAYFSEVDLPISDLTKNENIGFSIKLTPSETLTTPLAYDE